MGGRKFMLAVLEYVLSDFWRFLQCVVFLMIVALWKPIDITILTGEWRKGGEDQ